MKFKGTKGEWIITEIKETNGFLYVGKYKNDSRIATCYTVDADGAWEGLVTEETRANAKLIASAPDLLEALLKVKEVLKKEWPLEEWEDFDKEIGYSKAINKALN